MKWAAPGKPSTSSMVSTSEVARAGTFTQLNAGDTFIASGPQVLTLLVRRMSPTLRGIASPSLKAGEVSVNGGAGGAAGVAAPPAAGAAGAGAAAGAWAWAALVTT